jgi:hypothetical protein
LLPQVVVAQAKGGEMGPGHPCISCHEDSNIASGEQDAPLFAFAGTVYPTEPEPIDCIGPGSEGAQVELTDANGNLFMQIVNAAGNFSDTPPGFAYPYTAKVRFQGRERAMLEAQPVGDCNMCQPKNATSVRRGAFCCLDCERDKQEQAEKNARGVSLGLGTGTACLKTIQSRTWHRAR